MREKGKPPVKLLPAKTLRRGRELRRDQTDAELKLWRLLHSRRLGGAKFRPNHPIGPYFADFCCLKSQLIVELDGSQHADEDQAAHDRRRTAYLPAEGFTVIRFWNEEIFKEVNRVVDRIYEALNRGHPEAEPSP